MIARSSISGNILSGARYQERIQGGEGARTQGEPEPR